MESGTIRVGIIGCGAISSMHIQALMSMPEIRIAAVCDIQPQRAQAAAEKTGAKAFYDWHALLADPNIQAVHICLPHDLQAPVAIEALHLGKHVLTEKPMASTLEDARAMIAASEAPGAGTLGVIFQNRYNPATQAARTLIRNQALGAFLGAKLDVSWHREAPYYTQSGWRGTRAREGAGSLINQAIHTLDLASYLCGPIARVRGAIFTGLLEGVIDVEDNVSAVALYEGGQPLVIHTTNNYVIDSPVLLEMQFERAALRLEGPKLYQCANGQTVLLEDGSNCASSGQSTLPGKAYWGTGHAAQIADYYRAIQEGRPFWLDGREGFPALSLVKSIVKSSDEQRWVALEKV